MMVPEPTEAMVEAGERAMVVRKGGESWITADPQVIIKAAFAAAPPEWLLKAALGLEDAFWQDCQDVAAKLREYTTIPEDQFPGHKGIATANLEGYLGGRMQVVLSRALRGGEKP